MEQMDKSAVTRVVTAPKTRRGAFRSIAAALFGGAAAVKGASIASAQTCLGGGQVCTDDGQCCSTICLGPDNNGTRFCWDTSYCSCIGGTGPIGPTGVS